MVREGVLSVPVCADRSCMSKRVFEKLKNLVSVIETKALHEPIECTLANGMNLSVNEVVGVHLIVKIAAGPVTINDPVQCLAVPGDRDKSLMGKDVLVVSGIDVELQLEMLATTDVHADQGDDEESDVGVAVMGKLYERWSRVHEKGFPPSFVSELERIDLKFDIWRLELGCDTPAEVLPCPALPVKKPGHDEYRLTTDYKP